MYTLTQTGVIQRQHDGAFIPTDLENADYRDFLAWVAQGNAPAPYTPPAPSVPQVVTRFQARAALHSFEMLDQVEELMNRPETDPLHKLAWTDAQEFRRNSPTLMAAAQALGLSEAVLDNMFTYAAGIEA